MKTLKTWDIRKTGWTPEMEQECAGITKGRTDMEIKAPKPGVVRLVQHEKEPNVQAKDAA